MGKTLAGGCGRRARRAWCGSCTVDFQVHVRTLHLEGNILRCVNSFRSKLNESQIHGIRNVSRGDDEPGKLREICIDMVEVDSRYPRVDSLLLALLVLADKQLADKVSSGDTCAPRRDLLQCSSIEDVLRCAISRLIVSDGPYAAPNSLPYHDLNGSSRSIGRSGLILIEKHIESNVGLGSNGLESSGITG